MKKDAKVIKLLLHAYPAVWRGSYGEELVGLLEERPMTLTVVRNVLQNGLLQRARDARAWQLGSIALVIWLIAGTSLNSIRVFPQWGYSLFWQMNVCSLLVIGYASVVRDHKSRLASALAAGTASVVGVVPEVALAALWLAGLVHPTISQLNGSPMVVGHGVTDLCIRADANIPPTQLLFAPIVAGICGVIAGGVGASAAQFVSGFREGFRRSRT